MISVVIPAFNEASNLRALWEKLSGVFAEMPGEKFECVIVDDGSIDESSRILREIRREDPRLHWVRLLKNSGSHEAIGYGLKLCGGDAAIVLAADLQDPPEVFRELIARWRAGAKIVWAVRTARPGEPWFNLFASLAYYRVMNSLLAFQFPSTGADFFLADRAALEALRKRYRHHSPNIFFQLASLDFPSATMGYAKRKRHSGKSKWSMKKRAALFVDSVLAFSPQLLRWIVGFCFAAATVLLMYKGWVFGAAITLTTLTACAWRLRQVLKERPVISYESSLNAAHAGGSTD